MNSRLRTANNMEKTYYVTYTLTGLDRNLFYSDYVTICVEEGTTPGVVVQLLESELVKMFDGDTIVILNFWEM